MKRLSLVMAIACGAVASPVLAQRVVPPPKMSQAEGVQLFEAGGFKVAQGKAINLCGSASDPKFVFMDLNGDGAPEAAALDKNAECYGAEGYWFTVLAKGPDGRWRAIMRDSGRLNFETSRSSGWLDARVTNDCVRIWKYAGDAYRRPASCARPAAASADTAAALRAAGFVSKGGEWLNREGECEAAVEPGGVRDLNGDGRPEVVITETGTFCYGNTGQGFYLMQQGPDGAWKTLYQSPGVPEFLAAKGSGGWPDIEIGGPGFCFPVVRFNGSTYVNHRQTGACARR